PFFLQAAQDETIDRVSRPLMIFCLWNLWALGCDERPMFFICRTFFHPPAQERDLIRVERSVRFWRRHPLFRIARFNSSHQWTFFWISPDDRRAKFFVRREGK